ncbi:MAG TPA: hypothetical protein VGI73_13030 [Solirubrobacterales bacterium]|jgi:hypothetical protein
MAGSVDNDGSEITYGRYQGAHRRRLIFSVVGFVLLVVVGYSWLRDAPSFPQIAVTILVAMAVLGLSEWIFIRRVGIEIQPDGLVLCGSVRKVAVPWSRVRGFTWKEARSLTKTEYLYVETDQSIPRRVPKDAPIRLPTVARTIKRDHLNDRLLGPVLTSPNLRSTAGVEVDATEILERAWALGQAPSAH